MERRLEEGRGAELRGGWGSGGQRGGEGQGLRYLATSVCALGPVVNM